MRHISDTSSIVNYGSSRPISSRKLCLPMAAQDPEKVRYTVIGVEMKGVESTYSMKIVALGATQRDVCSQKVPCCSLNPSNAEATFVQSTMMQRFMKNIRTLSCWYSWSAFR